MIAAIRRWCWLIRKVNAQPRQGESVMISSECARRTLVRPDMIEVVCESQGWTCMHAACSPFAAACALVADAGKACVGRSRRVNIFPATVNSNIKMRETESPRLASYTPARCSAWFTMQADLAKPQAGSMAVVFLIEMAAGPSQKANFFLSGRLYGERSSLYWGARVKRTALYFCANGHPKCSSAHGP